MASFTKLKQTSYAKKHLDKAGLSDYNVVKYPMEPMTQFRKDEQGKKVNSTVCKSYVGGLWYLVHTRPDIALVWALLAGIWSTLRLYT